LSPENPNRIQAHRLRLVEALPDESLASFGRRTANTWSPANSALMNALFSNHVFQGGEIVKISRAETFVSSRETDGIDENNEVQ